MAPTAGLAGLTHPITIATLSATLSYSPSGRAPTESLSILDRLADNIPGIRAEIIERLDVTAPVAALPAGETHMAEVDEGVVTSMIVRDLPRAAS